jgi:osmotically inducible protein OsmC
MTPLCSTKGTAKGGRHGSIRSEDGLLDLGLALPKALGRNGGTTDSEHRRKVMAMSRVTQPWERLH